MEFPIKKYTVELPSSRKIKIDGMEYTLLFLITITSLEYDPNKISIKTRVIFPLYYPETEFMMNIHQVATLDVIYHVTDRNLDIDIFYVYSNFAKYKKLLLPEEAKFFKGFGKYMLCKVIRYLMEETSWFSPDATVTLVSESSQCYEISKYNQLSFTECITILQQNYPISYMNFCILMFKKKLYGLVQRFFPIEIDGDTIYDVAETHTDIVLDCCSELVKMINESEITEELLEKIQYTLCKIDTTQALIEKNYKEIYHFEVIENHGEYAKMKGTVTNILKACGDLSQYDGVKSLSISRKRVISRTRVRSRTRVKKDKVKTYIK
jgi:hypothetical protein